MKESKDFLARWSRRKLNPETEKPPPAEKQAALPAGKEAAPVAEFDITTLPSLESIGANSDIRAFLQQGVPVGLTRAALRRAWSADPAIRDFIGLSENSWDFNKPDSIPGFGSLDASEAKRIAAHFFGELEDQITAEASDSRTATAEPAPEDDKSPENAAEKPAAARQQTAQLDNSVAVSLPDVTGETDVAAQHEDDGASAPLPRRHGAALPK